MCGIAGVVSYESDYSSAPKLEKLLDGLKHRGPNGSGNWNGELFETKATVAFGHHRLAIVDLDERANQPMISPSGSALIINGEIYNAPALRIELKNKYEFRTSSDSEVVLALLEIYGLDGVAKLDGMFAFAFMPANKESIWLCRDRLGIKPLYYSRQRENIWFSSEAKPLAKVLQKKIDEVGFSEWAIYQFQISDRTFFDGILSVPAGHLLTITNGKVKSRRYWNLEDHLPNNNPSKLDAEEVTLEIKRLLKDSVNSHLMSDVEVATIISGGVDSSVVSSLASEGGVDSAFVGRFLEPGFDETNYAQEVADKNNLNLSVIDITADDFFGALGPVADAIDFPIAGPGSVGQYLVAKEVSKSHKVLLAGTGGDELFLGYVRDRFPLIASALNSASRGEFLKSWPVIAGDLKGITGYSEMLRVFEGAQGFSSPISGFLATINRSFKQKSVFNLSQSTQDLLASELLAGIAPSGAGNPQEIHDALIRYEMSIFLPSLLHVEDRMTMIHGLESRVPLLDLSFVELILSLPLEVRLSGGRPKDLLRNAMGEYLPKSVVSRSDKMGFPVPLREWAKGPYGALMQKKIYSLISRESVFLSTDLSPRVPEIVAKGGRELWALLLLESWLISLD